MSWFDRATVVRRAPVSLRAVVAVAAVSTIAAAGCADGSGFQPVYGSLGSSVSTAERLKDVDVAIIPGRVGQRVRNEIQFKFNDGQNGNTSVYRLETALTENLTTTLARSDGLSSSQVYQLTATFKLVQVAEKKVVFEGKSIGRSAFERNASIYSNVRAREDAENRAAKTVATEMTERVATFLSRPAN